MFPQRPSSAAFFVACACFCGVPVVFPSSAGKERIMQKIYLVKKDPDREEHKDNWTVMKPDEFRAFIKTPEGRRRRSSFSVIDSCGCGDGVIVAETSGELRSRIRAEHDRNTYLRRCSAAQSADEDYVFIRYSEDADQEREQRGRICSPQSSERPVEDEVIRKTDIERLRRAVGTLGDDDRRLIMYCFLSPEPLSEKEFGEMEGMSRDTVHARKRRILRALRDSMEK